MNRVAGVDNVDNFMGIAVNQGYLAGVPQCHTEQVLQVQIVHLLGGTFFGRDNDFPGGLHVFKTELRRLRRFVHDVLGHQLYFFFGQVAGGQPVRHARW